MKSKAVRFFAIIFVLSLSILACNFGASPDTGTTTEGTPAPKVLFQDDFSRKGNNWLQIRDEEGITDFDQDGYRIKVDKENWFFWSTPELSLSNVAIDVDATKIGGPNESEFGVICRYIDENNFYFFSVTSDGYFSMNKYKDGDYSFIGMEDFGQADNVNSENALNHLRVECNGTAFRLFLNGQLLGEAQDDSFSTGDVGLIAGTTDVVGTDILFDNFVVTEP